MMPRRFGEFAAPCAKRQKREAGNKTMREPGYYLILFINEWQPARWSPREDQWEIIGSDVPLDQPGDEDDIKAIGPKLEPPD
jgi:hypothetical protein